MCGQCGIILGKKRRSRQEIDMLGNIFTALLQYNEHRGRDATGVYIAAAASGAGKILKAPISAMHLTETKTYQKVIREVSNKTIALIGHTRWKTVGTPLLTENNHPISTEYCVGTHNGTIMNHNHLFQENGWQRNGQVDSEAIFRCADSCIHDGQLDMVGFAKGLEDFCGTMSFVLQNRKEPTAVYIGYGNMPLRLRYHTQLHCLCYSSELMPLVMAGKDNKGWQFLPQSPMTLYRFDISDLTKWDSVPMKFDSLGRG